MVQTGSFLLVLMAVVAILIGWRVFGPGPYAALAECLGERGVTLYGADGCARCIEQQELFGRAASRLPHVECSPPNRGGRSDACDVAGVVAHPTWVFPDGSRTTGVVPLSELARRTGCSLP